MSSDGDQDYKNVNAQNEGHPNCAESPSCDVQKPVPGADPLEDKDVEGGTSPESVDEKSHLKTPRTPPPRTAKSTMKFEVPLLGAMYDGDTLSEWVRSFESYIGDNASEQIQPFLNNFCDAGQTLALLGSSSGPFQGNKVDESRTTLREPVALRHIRSTPLVHTHSIIDEDEDDPPPVGLEILNRSRSTPLSTSANSAFGSISRLNIPAMDGPDDRSAFLPPYRLKPVTSNDRVSPYQVSFNPIHVDNEFEAVEQTAIEVTDISISQELDVAVPEGSKKSSRAAKFLSEVRNLGRRQLMRNGRENPAQPPSISDDSSRKSDLVGDDDDTTEPSGKNDNPNESKQDEAMSREGINTEVDNGCSGNESHENVFSHPVYQTTRTERVQIQVSSFKQSFSESEGCKVACQARSPDPNLVSRDASSLTPQSHDSPETSRSSGTSLHSGHTTHASATTYSSGQASNLSAISETDFEVMEVNKSGKPMGVHAAHSGRVAPAPTSRRALYPGIIEVSGSPSSLREGASVPAERFFTMAESPMEKRGLASRLRSASRRSGTTSSPNTVSSSSMTTNSSTSSHDEPPTFVSYLDRKTASDLTSLRETDERTETFGRHERGSSPSESLGDLGVTFEEPQAPFGSKAKPRPMWPSKGFQFGRKVRSLPPRSPAPKGTRTPTATPPPRGGSSPGLDAISPPRNIIDHQVDFNLSRPYVLRSTATRLVPAQRIPSSGPNDPQLPEASGYEVVRMATQLGFPYGNQYYVAQTRGLSPHSHNEQNIEVLKPDSPVSVASSAGASA